MIAPSGPLQAQRNIPPGRASSSQTVISQPGGPSNHRLSSSGLKIESQTSSRGASNSRTMTISRSVGVVSFRAFRIGKVLSGFLLPGLQLVQEGVEALEVGLPEFSILLQPLGGFGQRPGLDPAGSFLGVASPGNEASLLKHLEVFGNRGLAQLERSHELINRGLALRQPGQDSPAGRVRQGRERGIEASGHHGSITLGLYIRMEIYRAPGDVSSSGTKDPRAGREGRPAPREMRITALARWCQ